MEIRRSICSRPTDLEAWNEVALDEALHAEASVVLGAGERLFGEGCDSKPMRLIDSKTIGDGLILLTYEFVRSDVAQAPGLR